MKVTEVEIHSSDAILRGADLEPSKKAKNPRPAVLVIHGWGSSEANYRDRVKGIVRRGFICMTFSLRGHGESDGDRRNATRAQHLKDAVAAYDALASRPEVDPARIGVFAASYGAYLAMLLSRERSVAWLALRAPAIYPDSGFALPTAKVIDRLGDFRRGKITFKNNRALAALRAFAGPVLVVAGGNDEHIPPEEIESIKNAANPESAIVVETIPRADHRLSRPAWRTKANRILTSWMGEQKR